ncbi:MAG: nucleotidyl transferase AbiEii/AbiGii toxin family protein [Dysgonamonadaceae bacterium]|jgi:predicted nucleotidyltransferase component of viral defense system|nr:nucleotidyl transferase AbiEii/AbiGii toxin family protein [Dysgonamonadaceae bacterium]
MLNEEYKERVRLLLRIIPVVSKTDCFAIHGGTAINLFLNDLLRYSVDIDLTYIPVQVREESLSAIKRHLNEVKDKIKNLIPGIVIQDKPNKLICTYQGIFVKIEVNDVKRGVIADTVVLPLCKAAQDVFNAFCEAKIVPLSQLYGGKITAALDRQHPRDLFDVKYMFEYIKNFDEVKQGFMFCLLGSDRPVVEMLSPNLIDQREALDNQFTGMTTIPFSYEDYEKTRLSLIEYVNNNLTDNDKHFLISFEKGTPEWEITDYPTFKNYPSVQWKLLNINKLKEINPTKHKQEVERLREYFSL